MKAFDYFSNVIELVERPYLLSQVSKFKSKKQKKSLFLQGLSFLVRLIRRKSVVLLLEFETLFHINLF